MNEPGDGTEMGGYVGASVVLLDKSEGATCFDVYIWHDGEFPFSGKEPHILHHCEAEQFIEFGRRVQKLIAERHTSAR